MHKKILVFGAGGYVGSKLVHEILNRGYQTIAVDWFIYGNFLEDNNKLKIYQKDIRDYNSVKEIVSFEKPDAVINLCAISNDPMGDLNPELTQAVNVDAQKNLIDICFQEKVKLFVFASSSSVYGENEDENIDETTPLAPITLYSKTKVIIEKYLKSKNNEYFHGVSIRPATVCGWSPRPRLDLIVNLLTFFAHFNGEIKILGGDRVRPHIHIEDMVKVYLELLDKDPAFLSGKVYNAGSDHFSLNKLGNLVQKYTNCKIEYGEAEDNRSHRLNSEYIMKDLNLQFTNTVEDAIQDVLSKIQTENFDKEEIRFFNLKWYEKCIKEGLISSNYNSF